MSGIQTEKLVFLAQKGDPYARNILLSGSQKFIMKTAARFCNRTLQWPADKEMEIAFNAFDEAIDSFSKTGEERFLNYAQKAICCRLYLYFKREGRLQELSGLLHNEKEFYLPDKQGRRDRKEEIRILWEKHRKVLEDHGVTREDLMVYQKKDSGLSVRLKIKIHSARSALKKYWEHLKEDIG